MASSSVASPLCTWLVAACMSVTWGKDQSQSPMLHSSASSSSSSSSKRLGRWARNRRKALISQCCGGSTSNRNGGLISSFCGSSIQGLMASCLAFEPCNDYYSSKNGSLFGQNGSFSSFFGSKNIPFNNNRKLRRLNRGAVHSGEAMAVAVQPTREITTKKKPPTKQRRVVVTGMGVVTPLGHDPDVFYNNLLEGASGISEIETFDCAQFPTRIAGEIKSFSTDGWVAPKLSKRMDKFMLYMLTAGKKALEDGGVTEDIMEELDKTKCGVLIGSAMGGMKVFNDAIEALRISYKKMNPFCVPFATTNMGSAMLAMDLGWMGPNYSISTACATSNFCILNAANHIIRGEADVMLCGGSDAAIIPIGLGGFVACKALSQRNNDPTKASRPWDVNRDGFVMGEGAGVLLLEELEHAKRRGATIYAEFLGGSFTCDAYHMTEPHPDGVGVILCIEKALAQSGVSKEDINYINAHATSTPAGDIKEYEALMHCFGKNPELRVNSTKSMIGHLLGAAGAVEAVAAVQAIRTGWVHPNVNLESPDEGVDTNVLVGPKKERLNVKAALSNSFGFGGHNSSIIFAPFK
ncbi:3-oxoacyl-[acyl-carrier-protein] synthase II, chloroplastic-like [Herrania umbratica]|uniref:beta-ketoacyl-[acyl-carrier-protein] synthase I n=1 Tax=Herrania umbratica TaxID=108875 RepID=A0A6J0ZNU2_9ROSI|nr:3-oxoacyl-[acyl-carrier-protein] synthase II, chloroplastic-like [Herrania umbratica]XP_021276196.1 3-oxoacyl-[acyl-carrier-protein] synthase II, chloroplastic-like [Herrania umbratica]XP_021276197.1 3-oxoacyl-[acyl-carrier-protein] synthase II, chloroplastic-like [Herrania umbratica]